MSYLARHREAGVNGARRRWAHRDAPAPPAETIPDPSRAARLARILRVATWDEAPARCPACGGPYRRVREGLSCAMCARVVVVVAMLPRDPRPPPPMARD